MRNTIRDITLRFLGLFRRPKSGIHIINAHYLYPYIDSDNGEHFIKQLNQIIKYCDLIRFEKAVELINKKVNVDRPLVAFTFDDGFLDCYTTIAPILESYDINAGFFIFPNIIESSKEYYNKFSKGHVVHGKKFMNWNQIKDLHNRGHIIGSHTMDHIDLGTSNLTNRDLQEQIVKSKKVIEFKVGNNCNMFAFPNGRLADLNENYLSVILKNYDYVFSGSDYKNYYSFNGKVINRRHLEPFWPISHLNYFLSANKKY